MSWIGFFTAMASIPSIGIEVSWIAFLPSLIICLVTGLKFCQVLSNEHTEKDYETRRSFYRLYFILQVCVQAGIFIITFFVLTNWLADNC